MNAFKRIIFLLLFWALVWVLMALGHDDMLHFLVQNLAVILVQIIIICVVTFLLAPKVLSKNNQALFVGLGLFSILLCAFLSYQLSIGIPTPNIPHLPQDMPREFPPNPRRNFQPLGMLVNTPFLINFLLLCLTFILTTVIEVFLFAKRKEAALILSKAETLETELKLLKSQINPHFLFNALNNIYALSAIDTNKTQKSISYLSNMLRYVLYECERPYVTLQKEVAYIEDYIKLYKLKSSKKYPIETQFNSTNGTIEIAPMLLIPFVENAFKHSNIESVKDAFIKISVDANEDYITFKIENTVATSQIVKDEVGGIGLENVKKRLAILYPEKHELKIVEEKGVFKAELKLQTDA